MNSSNAFLGLLRCDICDCRDKLPFSGLSTLRQDCDTLRHAEEC